MKDRTEIKEATFRTILKTELPEKAQSRVYALLRKYNMKQELTGDEQRFILTLHDRRDMIAAERKREQEQIECESLRKLLVRHKGNRATAAKELKIPRANLYYKLHKYGLDVRPEDAANVMPMTVETREIDREVIEAVSAARVIATRKVGSTELEITLRITVT